MKCISVDALEAEDIRSLVRKVLKGLGNPEPPLQLEAVRALLKLDKHFYSSTDTSAVSEFVSKMRVAGKQIIHRPTLLWDAIKKADLSALYLPDRKRILIDSSRPQKKHRWYEAHEVGHSVIPWHCELNHGDNDFSLNVVCHAVLESEANYAAGQLLFLQDRFTVEARDLAKELGTVLEIGPRFGNTLTSTLWRYVEEAHCELPMVGLVTGHPHRPPEGFDEKNPCKYCVQSPIFRMQFSTVEESELYSCICNYCGWQRGGPLGEDDVVLRDDNGNAHLFHFETFFNGYDALTLGVHRNKCAAAIAV